MMKYLYVLILSLIIIAFGCEKNKSKSSNSDDFDFSEIGKVFGVSQSNGGTDLKVFHVAGYNVIVTASTTVQYWRVSCSGKNNGDVNDIHIGDTIEFKWVSSGIDYTVTPHDVRVINVEVWGPECWNAQHPERKHADSCNACTNNCNNNCNSSCNTGC